MGDAASGDEGFDATFPQQAAVLVVVVAPVGEEPFRSVAGATPLSPYRRDGVQKRYELGDVVPVAAGHRDGDRGAVPVDDHMVLGPGTAAVDGRGPDVIPPLSARIWEPSIAQSSISSCPRCAARQAASGAESARRPLRSSHAAGASWSLPNSPPPGPGHHARPHPCAVRRRCQPKPPGRTPAAARDGDACASVLTAATALCAPRVHPARDQQPPTRGCRRRSPHASRHADLILKRSVNAGRKRLDGHAAGA